MRPTAPMFPRSTHRSSILSRPSGRRSEPLIQNATVVLGEREAEQRSSELRGRRVAVFGATGSPPDVSGRSADRTIADLPAGDRAGGLCPEAIVVLRLCWDSNGGSGVLLGLPASERLVRLRLRWVHDLLVNARVSGQLDDVAVRIAEIDRAAEAVVDRAAHLNRAGAALLQHAFEDVVVDAERDVEVERVLALEVERLAWHLEEGEAGAIVHLEEGVQPAPLIDREGADQFEA